MSDEYTDALNALASVILGLKLPVDEMGLAALLVDGLRDAGYVIVKEESR